MEEAPPILLAARLRRGLAYRRMKAREQGASMARRATATVRLRPTFLVTGAQKAGTTSLHQYLAEHPAVLCATPKEVHFFNVEYHRGEAWYLAHFPLKVRALALRRRHGVQPAVGEVTPAYLFHPRVPDRVREFDPRMKLIAVLRDPVERAYSQYQMQVRRAGETLSFEDVLALEEVEVPLELKRIRDDPRYVSPSGLRRSYVARGRYAEQIERWLDFFPREQLLVLTSEELLREPADAMSQLAVFLGVPDWRAESYPLKSAADYDQMRSETRERLALTYEPHNRRLEELLGRELAWTRPAASAPPSSSRAAGAPHPATAR